MFSQIHPELTLRPGGFKDRCLSKSVSFVTTRENTVAPESNAPTRSLRWHSATFKMPRDCDVTPNKRFPAQFHSKSKNKYMNPNSRLSSGGQGIKSQLAEFYTRKADSMSQFYVPSFETAQVTLDSREKLLLKRAERKAKRKQNKATAAAAHYNAGYDYVIPDDIRLKLSLQKEKSFTLRRASEANLDKIEMAA